MKTVYTLLDGKSATVSENDFERLVAEGRVDEMGTTLVYGIADEETVETLTRSPLSAQEDEQ